MNDLEFIRKHVKTWPEGATSVRLDRDGEICFKPEPACTIYNFYAKGYDVSMFNANVEKFGPSAVTGINHTYAQLLGEQDLTTLDVPFGELDRDTQLRLVNHVLDGGETEMREVNNWRLRDITGNLYFISTSRYRAVAKQPEQPTERETLEAKLHEQWVELNATMKRITEIK